MVKISDSLRKQLHTELDKQIEALEGERRVGELVIIDQAIIVYEDNRSRTKDENLCDNLVTHINSEFCLLKDGSFNLEERVIRKDRCGDIEEMKGNWKDIT